MVCHTVKYVTRTVKLLKGIRESNGDIASTIELIEYRNPTRKETTYDTDLKTIGNKVINLIPRPIRKLIPNKITAQQGATLYKIAKLVYGEASARSNELAKLNSIFNRNKDIGGMIIDMLPLDKLKEVNKAL